MNCNDVESEEGWVSLRSPVPLKVCSPLFEAGFPYYWLAHQGSGLLLNCSVKMSVVKSSGQMK